MEKILVTGATGLLGSSLSPYLRNNGYQVITQACTTKADVNFDLANRGEATEVLGDIDPTMIINLVGLTSVERCEEHPNSAYLANIRAVENLAYWIKQGSGSCHLVQISTDQVYDGAGLHNEEEVTLINTYALTKYGGEVAASCVPSTILRSNFVGKSKTPNRESLSDWVYNSLRSGSEIQVFTDVYFSPLSLHTLVQMIETVIKKRPIGVFNLGSHGGMSKADFVYLLANRIGLPLENISRIEINQARFLKTRRPEDMRMALNKFENVLEISLPNLNDEIEIIANEYDHETRFNY